jgi:hypothetical protein
VISILFATAAVFFAAAQFFQPECESGEAGFEPASQVLFEDAKLICVLIVTSVVGTSWIAVCRRPRIDAYSLLASGV